MNAENDPAGTRVAKQTLLICSLGGSPEPVIDAIKAIKPQVVVFVCSGQSRPDLSGNNPRFAAQPPQASHEVAQPTWMEAEIGSANAHNVVVEHPERIEKCIQSIRQNIDGRVAEWLIRGDNHQIIVDITGGTKVMSAALALCARPWKCRFYYTGGTQRDKGGLGVVQDGSEVAFETGNPWDALGYQAMEEYRLFFNRGQFEAARLIAEEAKKRVDDQSLKRQHQALETCAQAYAKWEAFDHKAALTSLKSATGMYANNMAACGTAFWDQTIKQVIAQNINQLEQLAGAAGTPSIAFVLDLLANAKRRGVEGRFDDAVARLYRCTEAIAQYQLKSAHQIDSGAATLAQLPEALRNQWQGRTDAEGKLKLALQDDYALLQALYDPLGQLFTELKMDGMESPLAARNSSILAHGFAPVSGSGFRGLLGKVEQLANGIGGDVQAPEFPKIGEAKASQQVGNPDRGR